MEERRVPTDAHPGAWSPHGSPATATAERHDAPRERRLVLVVEDNPNEREIYGKLLGHRGFDVMDARDGTEGLQLARRHHPDLVLLDLGLPYIDGLDVCRRLKGQAEGAAVPVVVLTAWPEFDYGYEARRAGCDLYLEKPQSPLRVCREVQRLIGRAGSGTPGSSSGGGPSGSGPAPEGA